MAITNGHQLQCPECGLAFTQKSYQQIFCQISCQIKNTNRKNNAWRVNPNFCQRCGESLIGKRSNAIYCSKTCKSMDHNFKHRSKSRVEGIARRTELYKRDNGRCYSCDKVLELNEIELDHLVPFSRHGDTSPQNLAVSCMPCNRSRGDRIGIKQLEKLFELRNQI